MDNDTKSQGDRNMENISEESISIVQAVDCFPPDIRRRLRDATFRLAEVYRASGIELLPREQRAHSLPANVIVFRAVRS